MIIQQFFIPGIAHSSYVVAGERECAVIDPARDIGRYVLAAREMGCTITCVLETHLHADFVSGHLDLADETGATIYAPAAGRCAFPHERVAEGDEVHLGNVTFRVIETPGHTPEHVCYVATDTSRGSTPVALFSGDTLFAGDVGRPDLFPGRAEELAEALFENLHAKVLALPDECEVYPAHGMGSLCGRAISAKRTTTIGYEKKYNYALRMVDRDEFVRALTSHMPAAPDHFARCSEINRAGPALMRTLRDPSPLRPEEFHARSREDGTIVLDVRSYPAFSGLHVPGSWHIDLSGNFATQAGWVLPPNREIALVVDDWRQAREAALQLRRVGLDLVGWYLDGGMLAWAVAGLPVDRVPLVSAAEAHALVSGGDAVLVDVRSREEHESAPVPGVVHIPWHDLRSRYTELDPRAQTIVMCRGGQRASIAVSILKMKGFASVCNLAGGYAAFRKGGFAP